MKDLRVWCLVSGVWWAATLAVAGCAGGGGAECERDAQCPTGRYCQDGDCTYDCVDDRECPGGQHCDSARGRCTAACLPTNDGVESCDQVDNDCDGLTDEAFPRLGTTCQNGACAPGTWVCRADHTTDLCNGPSPAPDDDTCDGLDDDCDAATDEDAQPQACPLQQGVCAGARTVCTAGHYPTCDYGPDYLGAGDTRCDQLDNDCDGATDEDTTPVLEPESGAQAADGLDNNCNGLTDEPGGVMVPVDDYPGVWIDAFEMTVFDNPDCTGARYGLAPNDDYPVGWPADFTLTPDPVLYACSLQGISPSRHLSFYRAQRACQAQGKRLCSREQHLRACNGARAQYFPYGFSFVEGNCNDAVAGLGQVTLTGAYPYCTAGNGVFDLSGNLTEWVSDDSNENPAHGLVSSWSYDRLVCWDGLNCYQADPEWPGELDWLIELLDCDVEHNGAQSTYPRQTTRASFGGRCCLDGP